MSTIIALETERLILRKWLPSDLVPFSFINSDPEVMEFFPALLSNDESNDYAQKIISRINDNGWGFWAVELKADQCFIGFVGLNRPGVELPFNPCIEIGWRLAKKYWGQGLATEAAQKCLDYAFNELGLDQVVSFTTLQNSRSQSVMEKLGMVRDEQTFDHPSIPVGHQLRPHYLYRINRLNF